MYLKTLTMKGFKSFASATTMRLEPGITAVVGPNGSGKSNVVDALAWVMGEQGAKSLRGGKMEDVIFAGTAGRPPLGRAEVALTIDNSDGALPIDYTEVTISRTMFRSGGSEYAINGSPVRLLDVQELLSDSGIGREMHVIVGQGQLDAVLRATPEERRGFIEEAAGVLKHRKRKEKALRKLDTMQANLTRLADLTTEIRRQLGPLGRQAEVARRAVTIQSDVRDARARLLADDLVQLTATLEQEVADESALNTRKAEVETAITAAREVINRLTEEASAAAPRMRETSQTWFDLSGLRERTRGMAGLAAERHRLLGSTVDEAPDSRSDPERLRADAAAAREQEQALRVEVETADTGLKTRLDERAALETAHAEADKKIAALLRARADRREGLAKLSGQVAAKRSRVEATQAELGRLGEAITASRQRAATATEEFNLLEQQVAGVEEGEEGLDAEHADALAAAEEAKARLTELQAAERSAETERATITARKEALAVSLQAADGAAVLLDGGGADGQGAVSGVLGAVSTLVHVEPEYADAIAAALGFANAVAVESIGAAVDALRHLKEVDGGQASLVISGGDCAEVDLSGLPEGARPALSLVRSTKGLDGAVQAALSRVVVVDELGDAHRIVSERSDLVAVTRAGDVLGAHQARGGSAAGHSVLHVQAAIDEADQALAEVVARAERAKFELVAARREVEETSAQVEATLAQLHDSDAKFAAVAEKLGQLGAAVRSATSERSRLESSLDAANAALAQDNSALEELVARLEAAQNANTDADEEPDTAERDELAGRASLARTAETEARLVLRTAEERLKGIAGRAESLERAAVREEQARERAAQRAEQRRRAAVVAAAVEVGANRLLAVLDQVVAAAGEARDEAERERAEREAVIAQERDRLDVLSGELRQLTDAAHRDEVARTQQRLRIEQLTERALEELGLEVETLVEEFGPHLMVPPSLPAPGDPEPAEEPQPYPFVRVDQEKRLKKAERAMNALGKVNPLALEEFAALEERHKFLVEQLDDLKRSKADLLGIVAEIDQRVEQVFTEAFADTAEQFVGVFSRLFPGGEGKLVLTDPSDMLHTGIEVEARPAGKKVKRLSLLSGGERSLTAVALLVSIFKARPSPFYVMDEVEAALDDVNLGRLIDIFAELRDSSQLIVITHQKRTMEGADALYGVTMRGDGVSTVISQRLERQEA